jgi:hypothetical protein
MILQLATVGAVFFRKSLNSFDIAGIVRVMVALVLLMRSACLRAHDA